jgi:hypothetical protein
MQKEPQGSFIKSEGKSREKSMAIHSKSRIEAFLEGHKYFLLWVLCLFALLRISFFIAAFPFFNNVDEQAHFDTVVKYSKGHLPREETMKYEYESAVLIALYGSPEYLRNSEYPEAAIPPPLWRFNGAQISEYLDKKTYEWTRQSNREAFSPPVYYAFAGAWYNLGKLLGIKGGDLLYWIRFLNIPIYAALFWFAYLLCRSTFKNDLFMQFGVLLLLAFFPQDVFFSINSDVLSPLFCLISIYLLIQILRSNRTWPFHFLTGLVVSATFLVKFSNCPILILFAILIFLRIRKLACEGRLKEQWPHLLLLVSGCLLPIIFWLGWNYHALGDITGNAMKVHDLGWTVKPFGEIWNHPIFTLGGFTYFASHLLETFWRGEFVWALRRMTSVAMDYFYVWSSCVFVSLSIINSWLSKDDYSPDHRFINKISAIMVFISVSFLALLSIVYDFGDCWYPSRNHPYFTSGRLIFGAFLPFLILYLDGLRMMASKISGRINPLIVVLFICIVITYSEIHMTYPVLKSNYNWFHIHG